MNKNQYPGATIMIVDDVAINIEVLSNLLTENNYKVKAFPSGILALKAAIESPPDLILLDIIMPEMDGYETCKKLKSHPQLKDVPVIFISSLSDGDDKTKAFEMGGVDYIQKPFEFAEILSRIQAHLQIKFMGEQLQNYSAKLEEMVEQRMHELGESKVTTIIAMAKLTEMRDDMTGTHVDRVRSLSHVLAKMLAKTKQYDGLIDDGFIEQIYYAAALHDIGKIKISDGILNKPGRLTYDEFEAMKVHTVEGANVLQTIYDISSETHIVKMGAEIALYHHEHWDGSGYPKGYIGSETPLAARITAVADVYDALRAERPYKKPFTHDQALDIIKQSSGTQFDPSIVDVLCTADQEIKLIYDSENQ